MRDGFSGKGQTTALNAGRPFGPRSLHSSALPAMSAKSRDEGPVDFFPPLPVEQGAQRSPCECHPGLSRAWTVSPWELGNDALCADTLDLDAVQGVWLGRRVSWAPAFPLLCLNGPSCARPSTMAGRATRLIFVITRTLHCFYCVYLLVFVFIGYSLPCLLPPLTCRPERTGSFQSCSVRSPQLLELGLAQS